MKIYEKMPDELCQLLHGRSINEAIHTGYITELGDEDGNFIFESHTDPDTHLALVQGYYVQCSKKLMSHSAEQIANMLGDLSFFKYPAGNKEEFRLGVSNKVKLGKPFLKIDFTEDLSNEDSLVGIFNFKPLAAPPSNPLIGTTYLDISKRCLRFFDGEKWVDL